MGPNPLASLWAKTQPQPSGSAKCLGTDLKKSEDENSTHGGKSNPGSDSMVSSQGLELGQQTNLYACFM